MLCTERHPEATITHVCAARLDAILYAELILGSIILHTCFRHSPGAWHLKIDSGYWHASIIKTSQSEDFGCDLRDNTMAARIRDALHFPRTSSELIDPYIPNPTLQEDATLVGKPSVTLTFATSLDSQLSLAPGVQTALSGPESKAMTHYLRSKHDAILIGVGTAEADNPSLNCRIAGVGGYGGDGLEGQPRPVVIDPRGRWQFTAESKVLKLAKEGKGKAPWVFTKAPLDVTRRRLLQDAGGQNFVTGLEGCPESRVSWEYVLKALGAEHIRSIMIEGGGAIINDLLAPENIGLVDGVIVTIAPTWLGKGGVQVCPDERVEHGARLPVARLTNVKWIPLGDDVVLCGSPS